jgi:hypothetical protein
MDVMRVCTYLGIDEEALKIAMSSPDFPKPTRVGRCGDIEFEESDIIAFDRSHPNICCWLEEAFDAMPQRLKKKGRR